MAHNRLVTGLLGKKPSTGESFLAHFSSRIIGKGKVLTFPTKINNQKTWKVLVWLAIESILFCVRMRLKISHQLDIFRVSNKKFCVLTLLME